MIYLGIISVFIGMIFLLSGRDALSKHKKMVSANPTLDLGDDKKVSIGMMITGIILLIIGIIFLLCGFPAVFSAFSNLGAQAICLIIGIPILFFVVFFFIYCASKKKFNATTITIIIIGIILSACLLLPNMNWSNYHEPSTENKMCELCDDRKATKGDYCSKCYNTLKGFQNTWG